LSRAIIEGKVVPGEAVMADLDAEGEVVFRTAPA
jgi:carbamoylphosphate synthase small subunit